MKNILKFLYFFICSMFLFSVPVFAYIDPSAMTYIIQLIAGVAIAAGAAFGFYFRKLKRKFSKRKNSDAAQDSWDYDEDDDDDTGFDDYDIDDGMAVSDDVKTEIKVDVPTPQAAPVYSEPVISAKVTDKFDERGGGGLEAENLELRRLLAAEREKVAVLKRALHICSENSK